MRTLKPFLMFLTLIAGFGLAACTTGGDMSGTAGEEPPSREEPAPPSREEPPSNVDPGGNDAGGGQNDPGREPPSEGGDVIGLEDFLNRYGLDQRIDFAAIDAECGVPCAAESERLRFYIEEFCDSNPDGCGDELLVLLSKERTATQVRNKQGLVGFPTAGDLVEIIKEQRELEGGDGGDAGGAAGGGDAGGDTGGGQAGGDTGGDKSGGDTGGDNSGGDRQPPSGEISVPTADVQVIAGVVEGMAEGGMTDVDWSMVSQAAEKANAASAYRAVTAFFAALADAGDEIPDCDGCLETVKSLVEGGTVAVQDLQLVLGHFSR